MKPIVFISLLILLFFSCESKIKIKQIEQLTKMIEETDSLNQLFEKNKLDSAVEYLLAANTCLLRLKNNYKPTKVDMAFGRKVDEFKKLQKLFKKKGNHKTIANEAMVISNSIREEKQALYNLKMDIESGINMSATSDCCDAEILNKKRSLFGGVICTKCGKPCEKSIKDPYEGYIKFEEHKINTIKVLMSQFMRRKNEDLPRFLSSLKELNDFMDKWEKENIPKKN